jgi:hypothetical protein
MRYYVFFAFGKVYFHRDKEKKKLAKNAFLRTQTCSLVSHMHAEYVVLLVVIETEMNQMSRNIHFEL